MRKKGMQRTNDVLAYLEKVLRENTHHYREDFDFDRERLKKAAALPNIADRTFYWMSRDCGTWCFRERDVLFCGSDQNIAWLYHEGEKGILTFRVLLTGFDESGEKLTGEIQPFPYAEQVQRLKRTAVRNWQTVGVYADGTPFSAPLDKYDRSEMRRHGGIKEARYEPDDKGDLSDLIMWEHRLQDSPRKSSRGRKTPARLP